MKLYSQPSDPLPSLLATGQALFDWLDHPRAGPACLWYLNPHTLARWRGGGFPSGPDDRIVADGGLMARHIARQTGAGCESLPFDYSGIAGAVLDRLARRAGRLALVGGTGAEAARLGAILGARHAGLSVVLVRGGYGVETAELTRALAQARPDLVLLSTGSPRQERLARALAGGLSGPVTLVTCGAFVHQTARGRSYPRWALERDLRWLYRIGGEPHVAPRVIRYYLPFALRRPALPLGGAQTNSA